MISVMIFVGLRFWNHRPELFPIQYEEFLSLASTDAFSVAVQAMMILLEEQMQGEPINFKSRHDAGVIRKVLLFYCTLSNHLSNQ